MRLTRLQKSSRRLPAVAAWGVAACLALLSGAGCNVPTFIDPADLSGQRFVNQGDPLVVQIVEDLDPVLEEGTREFVTAEDPRPEDMVTEPSDYVIGPGDVLSITISELQLPGLDTVKTTSVSGTGNITLPLLQNPVHVEGMTENELQREIVEAYRQAGIQERAEVSASVVQARNRSFSVLGSIGGGGGGGAGGAGQYVINDEDFRLMDALAQAGSISNPLLEDLYIIRRGDRPRRRTPPGRGGVRPAAQRPDPGAGPGRRTRVPPRGRVVGPRVDGDRERRGRGRRPGGRRGARRRPVARRPRRPVPVRHARRDGGPGDLRGGRVRRVGVSRVGVAAGRCPVYSGAA